MRLLFQEVSKYWEPKPRKRSKENLGETDPNEPEHESEPPNELSSGEGTADIIDGFSTPEKPIINDEYLALTLGGGLRGEASPQPTPILEPYIGDGLDEIDQQLAQLE